MITLIEQTLDIVNEMALTGNKKEDAHRIFNYIRNVIHWDLSKMKEDVSWIIEYLDKTPLRWIILYAPEEWKERAWEQILRQGISNLALEWLILHAPEGWKERAARQLLKQNPSNDILVWAILYAPEEWKEKAWEQLLKQNPSIDDLMLVMSPYAPEPYKSMAQEMLDAMK